VYHYGTPLNVTISALNLSTARILSGLILHFNLHRVHHTNPHIPWKSLPEVFTCQADKFDRELSTAVLRQFYGPTPLPDILLQAANKRL
jgi:fatty acid desaturase